MCRAHEDCKNLEEMLGKTHKGLETVAQRKAHRNCHPCVQGCIVYILFIVAL